VFRWLVLDLPSEAMQSSDLGLAELTCGSGSGVLFLVVRAWGLSCQPETMSIQFKLQFNNKDFVLSFELFFTMEKGNRDA
jgi:hypothetical protein